MNDLKQREYYKIFSNTSKTNDTDKLYLGYQSTTTEIILKKDNATYFHIPFFAEPLPLAQSSLIADGAIPGPIPAMADRIQQKQADYYYNTPWGNPVGNLDGTWLCSWLYSLSGEPPQWFDRYYNPGRLADQEALQAGFNTGEYIKNNPAYIDVPSTIILTPGTYFQYYHCGDQTAKEMLSTFAGDGRDRLRLSIQNWGAEITDESAYGNKGYIRNFNSEWSLNLKEPDVKDRNALSFKNTDFIDTRVVYNSSYNLQNEFTLNFWVRNDDWTDVPGTQLVGNFNNGGFGAFYNNLKYYPYFVIPENYYGHIFYYNQEGTNFLDKSTQPFTLNNPLTGGTSLPVQVSIDGENDIVVLDAGITNTIYKLDHTGSLIALARDTAGFTYTLSGTPKLLAINENNDYTIITTGATYIFTNELILSSWNPQTPYGYNESIAYNTEGVLIRELSCKDIKFDNFNTKWVLKDTGILFANTTSVSSVVGSRNCTNIAIDPENNLWALYDSNKIAKIDLATKTLRDVYEVGLYHETDDINKNISFINSYDRVTNTQMWYALIYHNYEKTLYQVTLQGQIKQTTYLPSNLNVEQAPPTQQRREFLQFTGKGDFTGYEWKRIFNKILYNNNPQIQFKLSVKKPIKNYPSTSFTVSVPVQYLSNKTWHMITCTLQNKVATVYVDTRFRDKKVIPGNVRLNYLRKNDLYIGTPCGKFNNLNKEINSTSIIFNGYLDDIKIYDYAIDPKFLIIFVRDKFVGQDLTWNIPTTTLQYVEGIDRFFKHKLPGSKSPFFKIKLSGLEVKDSTTRKMIEASIFTAIDRIKPSYTELLSIEWVD